MKRPTVVVVDPDIHKQAKMLAAQRGVSLKALVDKLLRRELKKVH